MGLNTSWRRGALVHGRSEKSWLLPSEEGAEIGQRKSAEELGLGVEREEYQDHRETLRNDTREVPNLYINVPEASDSRSKMTLKKT